MRIARRRLSSALLAAFLVAIVGLALVPKPAAYYPQVRFGTGGGLEFRLLQGAEPSEASCQARARRIADTVRKNCRDCTLLSHTCPQQLSARQQRMLAGLPVDTPVMRIPNGAVEFRSAVPDTAYLACLESQRQITRTVSDAWSCAPPDTALNMSFLSPSESATIREAVPLHLIFMLLALAAMVSALACYLIVRFDRLHARFTHDATWTGPQKFHARPTPRIGGVAIALGACASVAALSYWNLGGVSTASGLTMLIFCCIPAFAGGLGEDLTRRVGALSRLMLTMAAGAIASVLLGATLDRIGIPGIDYALQWPLFAILFTAFAVGGIANAANIIDGYNGLAGGYFAIVAAAIAWIAFRVGDPFVFSASIIFLGALGGFLLWNWPSGRLFMGDGGAYLVGFWIAEMSVLLVVRNAEVSPWFPFALLVYPIFETLFSVYRRSLLRGESSGKPDALHLHTLIFRRLIRGKKRADPTSFTRSNSAVAPYLWLLAALSIVPALFVWESTPLLVAISAAFCTLYALLYWRIVEFRLRGLFFGLARPRA